MKNCKAKRDFAEKQTTIKAKLAEIEKQDVDDDKRNQFCFNFRNDVERHRRGQMANFLNLSCYKIYTACLLN